MLPTLFATPPEFRAWLEARHDKTTELWVGFRKKGSGKPSITWSEAVDEALCFGWIDGVRKSIDDVSYVIGFTPRRPRSAWSAVNIKRAEELRQLGRMHAAGLKAFERRDEERSRLYSYEQRSTARFDPEHERRFRANKRAWSFFQSQAPWYRRTATWWVVSAKKDETRLKRLAELIDDSAHERPIGRSSVPRSRGDLLETSDP